MSLFFDLDMQMTYDDLGTLSAFADLVTHYRMSGFEDRPAACAAHRTLAEQTYVGEVATEAQAILLKELGPDIVCCFSVAVPREGLLAQPPIYLLVNVYNAEEFSQQHTTDTGPHMLRLIDNPQRSDVKFAFDRINPELIPKHRLMLSLRGGFLFEID